MQSRRHRVYCHLNNRLQKTEAIIRYKFKKKPESSSGNPDELLYLNYEFTNKWLQDMCDTLVDFDKHGRDITYDVSLLDWFSVADLEG